MSTTIGLLLDPKILSEDQVLALYNKAFEMLMEGKTYVSFEGEGTGFTSKFPIPVETMLAEARYCLRQINPTLYGYNSTTVRPYFV